MKKQEFYQQQFESLTKRYKELKEEKKLRDEILQIMVAETGLSKHTIQQIIYNKNYRNSKSETMPKA